MIDLLIINTFDGAPCQRAALGCGEVLHRMEGKSGKVGNAAYWPALPGCAESMGSICQNRNASHGCLNGADRHKEFPFLLYDSQNPLIVTGNSCKIHGDDRLCFGCNQSRHPVIIHLKGILLDVHQNRCRAHMANHGGCCRVGVGRGNHLIAGTNAQKAQCHFGTGGLGVQAHRPVYTAQCRNLTFQLLGSGTGGNPTGAQCFGHFLNLQFRNIRG